MFNIIKKLFWKKKNYSEEEEEILEQEWYDKKSEMMESILGEEHHMVMHAIIPYAIGGGLDLYYYPNGIPGTAIATKELSYVCRESSNNDKYEKYELVMFTRETLDLDLAQDESTPFGRVHQFINSSLNPIANYSEQVELNPYETCEFPSDMGEISGKCFVFSDYGANIEGKEEFGLLLVIEIFHSEMEFAMQNGSDKLFDLLKNNGFYPYSDMVRDPVV